MSRASVELSRSEVRRVADVCDRLRAGFGSKRVAAQAHGISSHAFEQIVHRPGALTVPVAALDAIAKAAGVSREDLLAGRSGG